MRSNVALMIQLAGALDNWLSQRVLRGDTPGVACVVVEGDAIALETAHGDLRTNSRLPAASLMKPMVATLTMQLVHGQVLGLDDAVETHMPNRLGDARITVRQLLTHTSGLASHGGGTIGLDYRYNKHTTAMPLRTAEPSTRIVYSNYGYSVLVELLELLTDQTLDALLRKHIFAPLDMFDSGLHLETNVDGYLQRNAEDLRKKVTADPRAYGLHGAGDLVSTASDVGRFLTAFTSDSIFSAELRREMCRTQWHDGASGIRWGLGWQLSSVDGRDIASHGGHLLGFHHGMFLDPMNARAGVVMTNAVDADGEVWADTAFSVFEIEASEVPNSPFAGIYDSDWGTDVLVPTSEDTLILASLEHTDGFRNVASLQQINENELLITDCPMWMPLGERMTFTFDTEGKPETVYFGSDQVRYLGGIGSRQGEAPRRET